MKWNDGEKLKLLLKVIGDTDLKVDYAEISRTWRASKPTVRAVKNQVLALKREAKTLALNSSIKAESKTDEDVGNIENSTPSSTPEYPPGQTIDKTTNRLPSASSKLKNRPTSTPCIIIKSAGSRKRKFARLSDDDGSMTESEAEHSNSPAVTSARQLRRPRNKVKYKAEDSDSLQDAVALPDSYESDQDFTPESPKKHTQNGWDHQSALKLQDVRVKSEK